MSRLDKFITRVTGTSEKVLERPINNGLSVKPKPQQKQSLPPTQTQESIQSSFEQLKKSNKLEISQPYQVTLGKNNILNVIELKKRNPSEYASEKRMNLTVQKEQQKVQNQQLPNQVKVCPQLVLIGPFDSLDGDEQLKQIEEILVQCNKSTIIQWIKSKNQSKQTPKDFRNIQFIVDEQFWCLDMQQIIQRLIKEQKSINSCIKMLPQMHATRSITLTRLQVFLLITSMFLCIIPQQADNQLVTLAELMAFRPTDQKYKQKPPARLEKLKCVVNYLKLMLRNQQFYAQQITYQRVNNRNPFYKKQEEKPLGKVYIQLGKIQSGYNKGYIIDFANANVGGGFLTNGCAQQEILFSIFPEMIITKLLCESLKDEQAIVVYGARRFNEYQGYSFQFKFKGTYRNYKETSINSCMIAVDAVDYKHGVLNKTMQYGKTFIRRQLHKIHLGLKAASEKLNQTKDVYTGRWGCGAFAADEYLKFCIQWIACSDLGLDMHFFTNSQESTKQLLMLVENLKHLSNLDLLNVIEGFGKHGRIDEKGFLQYLKFYV